MRASHRRPLTVLFALLALTLTVSDLQARENSKPETPGSQSAASSANAPAKTPAQANSNGVGNSSNGSSANGSNNSNSNGSNSNSNNSNSNNSHSNSAKDSSPKASSNEKLNPARIAAEDANKRASVVKVVRSRTSASCQAFSSAAKARLAVDPCSDFIVVFNPGFARANSNELLKNSGAQVKREYSSIFNGALISGPLSKMQALANNPNVLVIEDDYEVASTAIQSTAPWGLDRIDQRSLPLSTTFSDSDLVGANTYSFVVDTGIDATNVEFEGRVAPGFTAIADGRGSADCNGHGTHVAGTIGSRTFGVAKKTTLVPVRVLDCTGSGSYSSVISGLDWIAANYRSGDAAVVNMSLGGGVSSTIDGAVKTLISKGISVVVAAGNSNTDACNSSPARVTEAITVGATDINDARASYSNFGSCLDLFAPGSAITSTWLGSISTNTISGTSMATPHVTGLVARFLGYNVGLTPAQVAQSVRTSATKAVVTNAGTGSLNNLAYLEITPDLTTTPVDTTPTFKKTTPRGKR